MPRRSPEERAWRIDITMNLKKSLPLVLPVLGCLIAAACAKQPAATFEVVEAPPPHIDSVTHGAPDGAHPGDTVSLTMKGDPGLKASASLGSLVASVPLAEDASGGGLYRGSVHVPEGKTGNFDLVGRLEADASRFSTLGGPVLRILNPLPAPADLGRRAMTAADFNAQKVLAAIQFDFDRYSLRDDARRILSSDLEWLQAHPTLRLVIEGHCDERGTNEYNMALGDRRANTAKEFLVKAGMEAGRIRTISYGEERPVDPGHNEEAWSKNRRAELVLED
jgi:peptidoglycan-associated lipoprotein